MGLFNIFKKKDIKANSSNVKDSITENEKKRDKSVASI